MKMKKSVRVDKRAEKELKRFPGDVYAKFIATFEILEMDGRLEEPYAKKIRNKKGIFEIRVRYKGQWRAIYAYLINNLIVILSAFRKKTQKTPLKEIQKAVNRLQTYI